MSKNFRMLSLMIAMIMMVVMLVGMSPGLTLYAYAEGGVVDDDDQGVLDDEGAATLVTISDVEAVLDEGEMNVPFDGSSGNDFYRNLKFSIPDGYPITMIAMKDWWSHDWDGSNLRYIYYDKNNPTYFEWNKYYRCDLQVALTMREGSKEYDFADNATIRIGEYTYTRDPSQTYYYEDTNRMVTYFKCDHIRPAIVEVCGVRVNETNMNDILGDIDEGSTVSYEPAKGVLKLNNAHLSNDYQDETVFDGIFSNTRNFSIELTGQNEINFTSRADDQGPDYNYQTSLISYAGQELNIYGSGSLDMYLEPNYERETGYYFQAEALYTHTLNLIDTSLSITCKNVNDRLITATDNLILSGSSRLTIEQQDDPEHTSHWFMALDVYKNLILKDDSILDINAPYPSSIGINSYGSVILSDRSMLRIVADEAFYIDRLTEIEEDGHEYYTGEYEFVDVSFDNHEYGTALVGKSMDGSDKTVWEGSPKLGEGFYSYVQVPATVEEATITVPDVTYTGKAQTPEVKVELGGKVLENGKDYEAAYDNNINAGTAKVTVTGMGGYAGSAAATFTINKATNPLAIKGKTYSIKYSTLKKKAQVLATSKIYSVTRKGVGKMSYALYSAKKGSKSYKKYFAVNKTTGKLTVKKGLAKGTYKVVVKAKAAGNSNYKVSAQKAVTITIRVK